MAPSDSPSSGRPGRDSHLDPDESPTSPDDPDKEIRQMREREEAIVFIGFGAIGFYSPVPYFALPFRWKGTVLQSSLPMIVLAACVGVFACMLDVSISSFAHELVGVVLGFLLVIMANFAQSNYDTAINGMNAMVQDGVNLCADVLSHVSECAEKREAERSSLDLDSPGFNLNDHFEHTPRGGSSLLHASNQKVLRETSEFRRLVILFFRLCCYEVRADIQARKNRYTWLEPEGQIATVAEREKFLTAAQRCTEREWRYEHTNNPIGLGRNQGRFMISVRPAVVHTWMVRHVARLYSEGLVPSAPVHAFMLQEIDEYTSHFATFQTVDRTPLPFSYVQMTCLVMNIFVLTLPLALQSEFGWGTPFVAACFAYCYTGLYINSCTLRNPFNYDKTLTGAPINAFIQRLEKQTEAVLMDVNDLYEREMPPSSTRSMFKPRDAKASPTTSPKNSPSHSPSHSARPSGHSGMLSPLHRGKETTPAGSPKSSPVLSPRRSSGDLTQQNSELTSRHSGDLAAGEHAPAWESTAATSTQPRASQLDVHRPRGDYEVQS